MMRMLVLLLVAATVTATPLLDHFQPRVAESDRTEFRLSGSVKPTHYSIAIELPEDIFYGNDTIFTGNTTIQFRVSAPISAIDIHSGVTIVSASLVQSIPHTNLIVTQANPTTSIATLTLPNEQQLEENTDYRLFIVYNGIVEPTYMRGLYRSSYKDLEGETRYLVSTQFQPDHARNAFPCFDEPQYKAVFSLNITHPSGLTALHNSVAEPVVVLNESFVDATVFRETPSMSTYLVAFAVSDFTCSGGDPIAHDIIHRICSKNHSETHRALANQYSPLLMQALENTTGILYNTTHHKMDQLAVPDFSAGAMENWGLVTYREPYLLYDPAESSIVDKQNVITIIAHEFAHMWFGNLVTTKWWNNLFLNEGFASYFEYFTPAMLQELEVGEVWELSKQFIVDQVQNALAADGSSSSRALSAQASSSAEIWSKFDVISYNKGAAVLRMVHNFMGAENFELGVQEYLANYTDAYTEPWNLWSSLQNFVQPGQLPEDITLEQVMNNWVNQSGYPVIMVNASGDDIFITQKRFIYNGSDSTNWYVPISYTTAANVEDFQNTSAKEWLYPGNYILRIQGVLANNAWVIVNNRESSFYRVNYDNTLWTRIRNILLTNHGVIDVLNRAQIVDDVFNLARAGQLPYSEAVNILTYLTNETEYYPLYSAATNFDVLQKLVGENSTIGRELNNLQLQFLNAVKNNISFTNLNPSNHIETLKLRLVLARLCRLGDPQCVETATGLFRNFTTNVISSINPNLRSIVYCNGLRYSNDSTNDWNFLWTRFQTQSLATEKVTILSALGCTRDTTLLYNYLNQAINSTSGIRPQDITRVWSSVITSNPEGLEVAFDFYANNSQRLVDYFSNSLSLISTIANRYNTEEQLDRLEALRNNTNLDQSVRDAVTAALAVANNNYNWLTANRPQLEEQFIRPVDSGALRNIGMTFAVFICSLLVIFV